jgi:hypothetical protein
MPDDRSTAERVTDALAGSPRRYDPIAVFEVIVTRRNGDDQAIGDLAELQRIFGDAEVTRIIAQCAYALGHNRGAASWPADLKPGALAWQVAAEIEHR